MTELRLHLADRGARDPKRRFHVLDGPPPDGPAAGELDAERQTQPRH
jgi:hypothetical protein